MSENRTRVQLHKKDNRNEQWIPLTTGECVQLTDYVNNGESGEIEQTDDLNAALAKLENNKADKGESLSAYGIADAYTKDEVDAMFTGIYHVCGSIASANIHAALTASGTKSGDVYDLSDDTVLTDDFVEYEGVAKPIAAGTNIVVVNTGTEETPVYKFDTLAMNVSASIPVASSSALGGVKIGYEDQTVGSRNYPVLLDGNNRAYVNVPWAELPSLTAAGKCLKIVENNNVLSLAWGDDNDTQYESKAAVNNGTDLSLVTTGEKYVWNNKQDALPPISGKNGKFLKVITDNGTLKMSWENDNNTGTVTSVTAGAGLNTTSDNSSQDGGIITGTGTLYLTMSGVTAGSYGDSSAQTPSFGGTFKVPYVTVDKYGRVTGISAHTVKIPTYTLPAAGGELGGIKTGYTTPTGTKNYAVALDNENKAYVNVPWTDTTYDVATQSANGLMSSTDKKKLDELSVGGRNVLVMKDVTNRTTGGLTATKGDNGWITIEGTVTATADTVLTLFGSFEELTSPSKNNSYYLSIETENLNFTNQFVCPRYYWRESGATSGSNYVNTLTSQPIDLSEGKWLRSIGIFIGKNAKDTVWSGRIRIKLEKGTIPTDWTPAIEDYADVAFSGDYDDLLNKPTIPSPYTLPSATSNALGGIKIGYQPESGTKNYAVQLSGDKAYVNVPWTDTDTHYTATPILGTVNAKTNSTTDTSNTATYLNIVENNTKSGGVQITGSGLVTVTAKNGLLTINGNDPIPSQSGNDNKFLMTDGTALSWATPSDLNTFRAIRVNNTELLATGSNEALNFVGGYNVSLTTDNTQTGYASVTIDVSVPDENPSVSSGAASIAFKYGKNYFVGIANNAAKTVQSVAALQNGVTTLIITNGNGQTDRADFEANIFFKAGSTVSVTLPSGFLVIGDEPEYTEGNVYLVSLYKGTAIFGEMTVAQQ